MVRIKQQVSYYLDQYTAYGKTFEGENLRSCAQNTPFTIHRKTLAVHQAHAIMHRTQQKTAKASPLESPAAYGN